MLSKALKYKDILLFTLLLFISLIAGRYNHPMSDLKMRVGLLSTFFFVNTIIAYILTASRVDNFIKLKFDKLLISFPWGLRKSMMFYYLRDLLKLLLVNVIACTLFIILDKVLYDSRAVNSIISLMPVYCILFDILSGLTVILLLNYSLTLLTRSFIGNISAVIILLFLHLLTSIYYYHRLEDFPVGEFLLVRIVSLLVVFSLFLFSIYCNEKNIFSRFKRGNLNRKKTYLSTRGSLLSLIKYHWSYIWNSKLFIIIILLLIYIVFTEAFVPPTGSFGESLLYTPTTIHSKIDDLIPIVMILISVFIAVSLFDGLRINKFHRLSHSFPFSNISISISVCIAGILTFIFCILLRVAINVVAIYHYTGAIDISIIWWVLRSYIPMSLSYIFLITGVTILMQIFGKKSMALVFTYIIAMLIHIYTRSGEPVWKLISWGYIPDIKYSDLNPDLSRWESSILYQYIIYWTSISVLFLSIFSSIYPRGEKPSFISRIRSARYEWSGRLQTGVTLLALVVSIICGYNVYKMQCDRIEIYEKSIAIDEHWTLYKGYITTSQPEIVSASFDIDLYPEKGVLDVSGSYWVKNLDFIKIDTLLFSLPLQGNDADVRIHSMTVYAENETIIYDSIRGFYAFLLKEPLLSDDSVRIDYRLSMKDLGYKLLRSMYIAPKWSMVRSTWFAIFSGYQTGYDNLPDPENCKVDFRISAPKDQVVISDGILSEQIERDDRVYYHYSCPDRVRLYNFPVIASSEYEKIDTCVNDVKINLYYYPLHKSSAKPILTNAALILSDYNLKYGEIDLSIINITEAASYRGNGGTCFSNTLFFGETEFATDFSDTTHLMRVNLALAHEMAHFWWTGMQPFVAEMKSSIAVEALAELASIQQIPNLHKADFTRQYIRHLLGGVNWLGKLSLYNSTDRYSRYNKGPIVLRRISHMVGEDAFNDILKSFIAEHKGIPVSLDRFIEYLKLKMPKESDLIDMLFFDNIMYRNRLLSKEVIPIGDNEYKIDVVYSLEKKDYREEGIESVPFYPNEVIDITFLSGEDIIYSEEVDMTRGESTFSVILNTIPDKMILDYKMLYLDIPRDNELK